MAPDIPKIDPDRRPNLGDAAWNFRDELFRWLFHGDSLSDPRDRLIPFFGNFNLTAITGNRLRQATHSIGVADIVIFLLPFSAQNSLVKSKIPQLQQNKPNKKV